MSLLLLLSGLAHGACLTTSGAGEVAAALGAAESAFASMNLESFQEAVTTVSARLPCLREPITPVDAAAWHRVMAYDAWTRRELDQTRAAFRSALVLQPSYALPSSVAPPGNPLTLLYQEARALGPGESAPLSLPEHTSALVDGQRLMALPLARPSLVQLLGPSGQVLQTDALAAGAAAPDWSSVSVPAPLVVALPAPPAEVAPRRAGPSLPLLIAGGGALAVSGALYGAGLATRAVYDQEDTPFEDLEALRGRTNALAVSAWATGAVGLGLGASAFLSVGGAF